jgi:hypothetical protein
MTLTIEISSPDGISTTKEVNAVISRYRGTTDAGGDDPSTAAITTVKIGNRDVTREFDILFGLENITSELEIQ